MRRVGLGLNKSKRKYLAGQLEVRHASCVVYKEVIKS